MNLLNTLNLNRAKIKLIQAFEAKAMDRIRDLYKKTIDLSMEAGLLRRKVQKLNEEFERFSHAFS
ncbi:MAG: hypothetical protein WDA59_11370, partial [Methanofastidiosum sp.]